FCYDMSGFPHEEWVYLGHDFSVPVFQSIEVTPNPVRDYVNPTAELNFLTDDRTYCTLGGAPLGDYDTDDYYTYQTEHSHILNYSHITDFEEHNFTYIMHCANGADPDKSTDITVNVTVHFSDTVIITLLEPETYGHESPLNFKVKSNLDSDCSYRAEGMTDYQPMTSTDGLIHSANLGALAEGTHTVGVECISGTKITSEQLSFFMDYNAPSSPVLTTNDPQCGRGAVTATATSNDTGSGVHGFNFTLRKTNTVEDIIVAEGFVPSTGSVQLSYDREVLNGTTYYWNVFAIDKAGNIGEDEVASVRIFDADDMVCDFEDPAPRAELTYMDLQTDALVTCIDGESGCDDYFTHSLQELQVACEPVTEEDLGTAVSLYEQGKFCYRVFDLAENEADGQKKIRIYDVPEHCSNGLLDINETSVDCGGDCIPCEATVCGDGIINKQGEQCDGEDFGQLTSCTDAIFVGEFTSGTLSCTDECLLDTSTCEGTSGGYCGDTVINPIEHCEPSLFTTTLCSELFTDATGGSLSCDECKFDTSACTYTGSACDVDQDCLSGVCELGVCVGGACDDGVKNGQEGGVDCGGDCDACEAGSECEINLDCDTGWCNNGICEVSACDDGVKNGLETGQDCGGVCDSLCPEGEGCESNADCETGYCDMDSPMHTCVSNPDADQDGIPDECEDEWGLDAYDSDDADLDPDEDGLTNKEEYSVSLAYGNGGCDESSDINDPDTDGDGYSDGIEVRAGFNPLDDDDHPTGEVPGVVECDGNRYCVRDKGPLAGILLTFGLIFFIGGILALFGYKYRWEIAENPTVGQIASNPTVKKITDKLGWSLPKKQKAAPRQAAQPKRPQVRPPTQRAAAPKPRAQPKPRVDTKALMKKKRLQKEKDALQEKIRKSFK
ncbi:MAG: hypothetical protein ACTSWQ_02265, partial [Candidatus Thorarchaeota archaeon]